MKQLTKQTFQSEIKTHSGVALIDFYADWCGPCKMLTPLMEELAKDMEDDKDVIVAKVNVDEEQELAGEFSVMSIPTVLLFKNGEVVQQFVGVQPKDVYKGAIENAKRA